MEVSGEFRRPSSRIWMVILITLPWCSMAPAINLVFEFSLLIPNADNPIVGGIGGPSYECAGFSCNIADERNVDANAGFASATPLPAALPLFASGLGAMGLFGWRRKRKASSIAAA
jgi:PEP-CTERM motif-containing protein